MEEVRGEPPIRVRVRVRVRSAWRRFEESLYTPCQIYRVLVL